MASDDRDIEVNWFDDIDRSEQSRRRNRRAEQEEPRRSRRRSEYEEEPRRSRRRSEYEEEPRRSRRRSEYEEEPRRSRRRSEYEEEPRRSRSRVPVDERQLRRDRKNRRRRQKKKSGGCLGGCLLPLLILLVIIGGGVYFAMGFLWGRVQSPDFSSAQVSCNSDRSASVKNEDSLYRSILLYGVDSRDQDPLKSGALADANILVTIHRETGEITMTSIYRDTYVETSDGNHMKLTEVYSRYGAKESLQTINKNFDLNVTDFVTVTWASVAEAINGLGGLDLKITAKEAAGINKYIDEVIKNTGIRSEHVSQDLSDDGEVIHLDGVQAVTFCRLRKGLGDDYQRTVRQRTVIGAAFEKAKANPTQSALTAYKVLPMLASNMSTGDLMSLMTGITRYHMGENYGFPQYIGDDPSYVYPNTLLENNRWLHLNVYGATSYTPSGTAELVSGTISTRSGYYGE